MYMPITLVNVPMNHQNEKEKKKISDCGIVAGRWNISETADFHAQKTL